MAVTTSYSAITYAGNGATTSFAVTWPFFTGSLVVILISATGVETVQTITTDYTVSGGTTSAGLPATGTVIMITAPASGETLQIERATPKTQNTTFANGDAFPSKVVEAALDRAILIAQETLGLVGPDGDDGVDGSDGGVEYKWDTSTTMADPGAGDLRLASTTQGASTQFAISASTAATGNPSLINWIKSWDDSSTTANRGSVLVRKATATENFIVFNITGAITDNTTWLTGNCSIVESRGSFSAADNLLISFYRTGDTGAAGAGSGDVVGPASATDNAVVRYDTTTGKLVQNSAVTVDDSGNMGGVVTIELGHASDTTLSRSAAGALAVEGVLVKMAGKETVAVLAGSMTPRITNGASANVTELATNDVMLKTFDFDATTEEGAGFWIAMPKSWNESTVTFKVFWTAASGSGGVAWGLAAYSFSNDDAMDTAVSGQQIVTDTLLTANDMHITSESSAITIGGSPAEGDVVYFELTREVSNGSDTLGVDAQLIGIHVYITMNASTDA